MALNRKHLTAPQFLQPTVFFLNLGRSRARTMLYGHNGPLLDVTCPTWLADPALNSPQVLKARGADTDAPSARARPSEKLVRLFCTG
jgi:hypothetical protein